jgi:hypothetical protein
LRSLSWLSRCFVERVCLLYAHLEIVWASLVFRSYRADYYIFLSEMMNPGIAHKTLLSVFEDDAHRYAGKGARGVLANYWMSRYPDCAGDLYATFKGTLPQEDIVSIRMAQLAGASRLMQVLRRLGHCIEITDRARREFIQTVLVGFMALLIAFGSLMIIPFFSYERLLSSFSVLPTAYYGRATNDFIYIAKWLQDWWILFFLILIFLIFYLIWTFPNLVSSPRKLMDHWGLWRLYRCMHAIRFLSLLSVHLDAGPGSHSRLKQALLMMQSHTNMWFEDHIRKMIDRIDLGCDPLSALDTGLLDTTTWWYLSDLVKTTGLDLAISRTARRVERDTLKSFKEDALILRWILLIFGLCSVLALAWWHFQVIEDLRRGLALFYSA